ncbi:MAG TPA: poly-gamma-glutamate system protein [Spirochaetota bacterium]|nr:poly-gamma-glutamate system protein [Spirochaetota bacterium]HPI90033.1 poly-gamma-glutamate system protein [Spirochaetota bacterium]HPR48085.1 poly-gamma-glutamate system protein [Spirochaetota bacterium]
MKKLMWRSGNVPKQVHIVIAITALIGIVLVESFQVSVKQPYYKTKIKAAHYMRQGMNIIRNYRNTTLGPVDRQVDPFDSGMIGHLNSPITSTTVDLDTKLTTVNPNWAAVIVDMLKRGKVSERSTVAVSFTGSFPAINIAVLSAIKAMKLRPVIITSLSSSTWGANIPGFTWLDMEQELNKKRLFSYKSAAASLGGVKDIALGMPPEGVLILKKNIQKHGIRFIKNDQISRSIDERMDIYDELAGAEPIRAYINVGGGTVSVGSFIGKRRFRPGLNKRPPRKALKIDSVMSRFSHEGIPVINMNYIKNLAHKYNLSAGRDKRKNIGRGDIYYRLEYNKYLVSGVLLCLILLLYIFMKTNVGGQLFSKELSNGNAKSRNPMV